MSEGYLEIQALSRPCYLGQLYNARTSSFIPGFSLFKGDVKSKEGDKKHKTDFKFTEIKSLADRTSSLDVTADLSVSIMSGAIGISGKGTYLNSKQDTSESITVAAVAKYRTTSKSLDLNALLSQMDMDNKMLARTQATHVVTSIIYGGNVIGTMTQKSTNKAESTDIEGKFSMEIFKGMGKWFSAEANAGLTLQEKEKLNSFDLDLQLSADFSLREEDAVPTDTVALIEIIKKSAKLVGDGVPCEVSLTPLSVLVSETVPNFRELANAELEDIMNVYNNIIRLENSYAWLRDAVGTHSELFPTFSVAVASRAIKVTRLAQTARDKLRKYLQQYRSESDSESTTVETPTAFVEKVAKEFVTSQKEYDDDKDEWRRYQDRLAAAKQHGFPVIAVGAIGSTMNRANKGMLAAILVPENANWTALMNLYGDIAVDIRQWRESVDKAKSGGGDGNSEGTQTEFMTIYADPLRDAMIDTLDDEAGTLKSALASARETKRAVFLTYGRATGHVGGLEWNVFNKKGWGIIINKEESWRYTGDVQSSKPHGSGIITYANETKYTGTFVNGQRDGFGEILDKDGKLVAGTRGVFIKNAFAPQGVLVEVTVVTKDGVPVQYGKVALYKLGAVRNQVDRIATVMGWGLNQRFRIIPEGGTKVDVVGGMIDPKEPASVESSSWNLEGAPKITAHIL